MRSTTSRLIAEHRAARQATAGHVKIYPWPGLHLSRSSPIFGCFGIGAAVA